MHLAFVDSDGSRGTVSTDGTIEYDGTFSETTEAVVSNVEWNGNAASDGFSDLMLALYQEGHLAEIEVINGTQHQHEQSREEEHNGSQAAVDRD